MSTAFVVHFLAWTVGLCVMGEIFYRRVAGLGLAEFLWTAVMEELDKQQYKSSRQKTCVKIAGMTAGAVVCACVILLQAWVFALITSWLFS